MKVAIEDAVALRALKPLYGFHLAKGPMDRPWQRRGNTSGGLRRVTPVDAR
jgi:hypothetical protein